MTYLSFCLSSFVLLFFPSLLFLLFSHFAFNDLKTEKKKNSTGFFIKYLSEDLSTIITLLFSIPFISCISHSAADTKILDIRLSDNGPLPQEFSYPNDEKILLDNNNPPPNCISIYGGLVNRA